MSLDAVDPVEVSALAITITVEGHNLAGSLGKVFEDATDTLYEAKGFIAMTPDYPDTDANWTTHISVLVGVRVPSAGNWEVTLFPSYGSPYDAQSPAGKNKPYYSRTTITAIVGSTSMSLDSVGSAEIVANGSGIYPTVVTYDPITEDAVVVTEGWPNALGASSIRIHENPNRTGLPDDGDFCLRYDHTEDVEGDDYFLQAAGWPCGWFNKNGKFLRGDLPGKGHEKNGFCCGERGPWAQIKSINSPIYPIEHINVLTRYVNDHPALDNTWKDVPGAFRCSSGHGPFVLNILSRHDAGDEILRRFAYAWILKRMASTQLQMLPSPVTPHTTEASLYNYDEDAMRTRGRVPETLALLVRGLAELRSVRDVALDPEVSELELAVIQRFVDILALIKTSYTQNRWIKYGSGNSGRAVSGWQIGHWMQGLIIAQESIIDLGLPKDPEVEDMLKTFAEWIHDHTYLWVNNGPHPMDPSATYTGGYNGYRMAYHDEITDPKQSEPTSITDKLTICYEWAKINGVRQGAKQDAIIAQHASTNYKWKMGSQAKTLVAKIVFSGTGAGSTIDPTIVHGGAIDFAGVGTMTITPTITGGGAKVRKGTAIAVTSISIGTAIAVSP